MKSLTKSTLLILLYEIAFVPLAVISIIRKEPFYFYFEGFGKGTTQVLITTLFVVLVLYGLILRMESEITALSLKKVVILLLPLFCLFIVSPPMLSRDILSYMIPAKNLAVFGEDPYSTPLNAIVQNDWTQYVANVWKHKSVYGPLFNIIVAPFGIFDDLKVAVASYKMLTTIAILTSAVLIKKIYNEKKALMLLLNPVLLVHFVMEGHNDVFMLLLLLLAVYFFAQNKNKLPAYIFLALSIAFKYYTVFLIPAFAIRNKRFSFIEFTKIAGVSALVYFLIGLVFKGYFPNLLSNDIGFYSSKCFYAACTPIDIFLRSVPIPTTILKLGIIAVFYLYMYTRDISDLTKWLFNIFMVISFVYLSWLTSWFLIFPITFSFLKGTIKYLYVSFFLTVYAFLHYYGI